MNLQTILLSIATLLIASDAIAQPVSRPNVLMILVDDLKPALGCYGDAHAKTPEIDRLASRGTRFELAYCNQAVCAPSRFTLMLGSHSTSTGLYGLGSQLREIVPDAVTLPQFFARHGYHTQSLGKVFHVGHGNFGDPESFQVPHFHDKVIEYLDPQSTDGGMLTREEAYFTNQRLGEIRSLPRGAAFESPDVKDIEYADGRVAEEAMRRLQQAKRRLEEDGTPFFMVAGFARPHLPFSAPQKYWDLHDRSKLPLPEFEDLPVGAPAVAGKRGGEISNYKPVPTEGEFSKSLKQELIHGYYASTSFVDAQIGKVIDQLDKLGLQDNTIIVLWGDHGFHLGDLGIWTKHTNYEQANRIPIVIVAPGVGQAGQSTNQLAESVDIYPTLAELAGLPVPTGPQPMDGKSLARVMEDPAARVRDHAFHAYPKRVMGLAIRTERYRLVQWGDPNDPNQPAEYELYDYQTDPLETTNIAERSPEIVAALRRKLEQYPAPVSRDGRRRSSRKSPPIANREITIEAVVESEHPDGVVLAQGGRQHGYALYFENGIAVLDVRRNEIVTQLRSKQPASGKIELAAKIDADQLVLRVDQETYRRPSAGLIAVQPMDELSIGLDTETAAGRYQSPHPFQGTVLSHEVNTKKPR